MPISRLAKEGKIKPEDIDRLDKAFALALKSLSLVDRDDPVCEIVARKIIEIDAAGTHNPEELAQSAAKELGIPK